MARPKKTTAMAETKTKSEGPNVFKMRSAGHDQFKRMGNQTLNKFGTWYTNDGNPASRIIRGVAKTSSTAAMGIYYAQDSRIYDWYDETVRKVPPLRTGMNLVIRHTQQRPLAIRLESEATPEAIAMRDFVEEQVNKHWSALTELLLDGRLRHGLSFVEMIWGHDNKGRMVVEEVEHVHPGFIAFTAKKQPAYYVANQDAGVTAGELLPFGKFVYTKELCLYGNPYGESIINTLEEPCMSYKNATWRILTLMADYGTPFPMFHLKDMADTDQKFQLIIDQCNLAIENMKSSDGLVVPAYADFTVQDRGFGKAALPHFQAREEAKREIIQAIYGSILGTTDSEHGSRAQADSHNDTSDKYTQPLARSLVGCVSDLFVQPLIDFNWTGLSIDKPRIVVDLDVEKKESFEVIEKTIRVAADLELDMPKKQAREWLGIDEASEGDEVITKPAPPAQALPFEDDEEPEEPIDESLIPPRGKMLRKKELAEKLGMPTGAMMNLLRKAREADPSIVIRGAGSNRLSENDVERCLAAAIDAPAAPNEGAPGESKASSFAEDEALAGAVVNAIEEKQVPTMRQAIKIEANARQAMFDLSGELARLMAPSAHKAARKALDATTDKGKVGKFELDLPQDEIEAALAAARLLGVGVTGDVFGLTGKKKAFAESKKKKKFDDSEGLDSDGPVLFADAGRFPGIFARGARWLISRKVVSPAQMDSLLESVEFLVGSDSPTLAALQREVRDQFLSLKGTATKTGAEGLQQWVTSKVSQGKTVRDALTEAREKIDEGTLEPVSDGYLENVARTETSSAMNAQRKRMETNPIVDRMLLGWIVMNPDDSRSRPSHAALDGEFIAKGSEAAEALGSPPWSYQCRCVLLPQYNIPGRPTPSMSSDIMTKIRNVERFSEGGICGCGTVTLEQSTQER